MYMHVKAVHVLGGGLHCLVVAPPQDCNGKVFKNGFLLNPWVIRCVIGLELLLWKFEEARQPRKRSCIALHLGVTLQGRKL
eukprot:20144-Heterococcus_DN1.PRE.2